MTNIKVQNDGDSYCLRGEPDTKFATLTALVKHYMDRPKSIKEKRGGYIELLYPVQSTDPTNERFEALNLFRDKKICNLINGIYNDHKEEQQSKVFSPTCRFD